MASEWHIALKSDGFDKILSDSRQIAGKIIKRTGEDWVKYTVELEPEKTGHLKETTTGEPGTLIYHLLIGADYWRFVNDGTRYITAIYFLEDYCP